MGDHAAQNLRRLHARHAEHPRRGGADAVHLRATRQAVADVPRHQHALRRARAEGIRRDAAVAQPDDQRRFHALGQHAAKGLRQLRRQRAPRFQRNRQRLLAGQRDIGAHRPAQPPRARLVLHLHDRARQAALAQLAARRLHGQIRPFRPHALASAAVYTSLSAKDILYTLFPPVSTRQKGCQAQFRPFLNPGLIGLTASCRNILFSFVFIRRSGSSCPRKRRRTPESPARSRQTRNPKRASSSAF